MREKYAPSRIVRFRDPKKTGGRINLPPVDENFVKFAGYLPETTP
jgi:hypothetical protein